MNGMYQPELDFDTEKPSSEAGLAEKAEIGSMARRAAELFESGTSANSDSLHSATSSLPIYEGRSKAALIAARRASDAMMISLNSDPRAGRY